MIYVIFQETLSGHFQRISWWAVGEEVKQDWKQKDRGGSWYSNTDEEGWCLRPLGWWQIEKEVRRGAAGWLGRLNIQLLVLAPVLISGSWD